MNRRTFLTGALAAGAVAGTDGCAGVPKRAAAGAGEFHVFSKMFQPPVTPTPEALCDLFAAAGCDGIQWTVRKGGHATPENATTELPRLVKTARSRGLKCVSICTGITSVDAAAERILGTAADCGISQFRTGYFFYEAKKETFTQSFDRIRRSFADLSALAARTGVKASYQNHSSWGPSVFGGLVWDVYECVRNLDPATVGVEYDPMHAYLETNLSWSHGLDLIAPWIAAVDLKDFHYAPDPKDPKKAKKRMVAAGAGIVPWKEVRAHLDANGVKVPYILHFEYDFDKTDLKRTVAEELRTFRREFA